MIIPFSFWKSNNTTLLYDEFFSSLDGSKWTVTNPDSANGVTYELDEGFMWKCAHTTGVPIPVSANYLQSVMNIDTLNYIEISFDLFYCDKQISTSQFELMLWQSDNDKVYIGNSSSANEMFFSVKVGGTVIYTATTTILNSRYKIILNNSTQMASGWVWNPATDSWLQIGIDADVSTLPSNPSKVRHGCYDNTGVVGGKYCKLGSLYMTNYSQTAYSPVDSLQDVWLTRFLSNTGISDATIIAALDTYIKAERHQALWSGVVAKYPFVGGSASTHIVSLKSNAKYQGTIVGTVTHNANGITPNGTTGYMKTGLIPTTALFPTQEGTLSVYSRTNNALSCTDIGSSNSASQRLQLLGRNASNLMLHDAYNSTVGGGRLSVANTSSLGYLMASRKPSGGGATGYLNGSSLGSSSATGAGTIPTYEMYIGALNNVGTAANFSNRNYADVSIDVVKYSDAEALVKYNNIQALQTSLSRQV